MNCQWYVKLDTMVPTGGIVKESIMDLELVENLIWYIASLVSQVI